MGSTLSKNESERTDSPSSVRYLVSVLERRIHSGQYPHGQWLPTERTLCEEFALGRPAVRQAIGELERRRLVRRSARHRPVVWRDDSGTARSVLPTNGRKSIGLWISGDPSDPGPMAMTRSILQALPSEQYRLVMTCPQNESRISAVQAEAQVLHRLATDDDCAGLILWYLGGSANTPALEAFRAQGKPLVFVDRKPPTGFEADYVGVQNTTAAMEAVQHLLSQGHRDIAHITNAEGTSAVIERHLGYEQALQAVGIPFRPDLVLSSDLIPNDEAGEQQHWRQVAARFLALPSPPTAAFAVNDYTASRFIRALRENAVRVPDDVAVIGFDNSERWRHQEAPFMSSVSQPFEQIGAEAVSLLRERLEGTPGTTYRHVLMNAPLVVRQSSEQQRSQV
ncbi:MAG: substrate-binding domain-containing protein [Cytophagales bacterium]|nr:substrate-binding domain-containing protein [Armatimonadota bacterium]